MAMTFADLQKAFELHINAEGEIDSAQLAIWFNEAQQDLALFYRLPFTPFTGTDSSQISELPPALHDLLPLFGAARYWDRESEGDYEESGLGTKWMNYYLQAKGDRRKLLDDIHPKADRWQVL